MAHIRHKGLAYAGHAAQAWVYQVIPPGLELVRQLRVCKQRPRQRDDIRPTLGDDALHQLGVAERADRDHRCVLHFFLDRLGEIDVAALREKPIGYHVLVGRGNVECSGGHVDEVYLAVQKLCEFYLVFKRQPALDDLGAAHAHLNGEIVPTFFADVCDDFHRDAGAVFEAAAVFVRPAVVER